MGCSPQESPGPIFANQQTYPGNSDGTVFPWGAGWNGQADVPSSLSHGIGIAAGENHTLVLTEGGLPTPRLLNPIWSANRFTTLAQTLDRRHYGLEVKASFGATGWVALPSVMGNGALKVLTAPFATARLRCTQRLFQSIRLGCYPLRPEIFWRVRHWC